MFSETYFTENIENFSVQAPRLLFGKPLKDVKEMEASIKIFGLLSPITAQSDGGKLIVVDGYKRLSALRRLHLKGELPKTLQKIPYVITNTARARRIENGQDCLPLLRNAGKYNLIMDIRERGLTAHAIALALFVDVTVIDQVLSVGDLCEEIQEAFFQDKLSLKQAHAFSSIPNLKAQNKLLQMMDDEHAASIAYALEHGKTVVDLGDDHIIFLPSRPKVEVAA